MKKQTRSLGLKKQTISALEARFVNGGAPTTHTMMTMDKGCISQDPCAPVPQDPRPQSGQTRCTPCSDICG
ncbi:hypothetical protein C8N46_10372 [Kordia periserrulae]|uniref:Uncharacterized protein n=1 Tax=Kordia periserrulae TaxID=701523 RepID=A0A2T6C0Y4_9FLAO|nr:hypothetical protein [Kordia periserrulae]PTX61975.1 hypothetical protein C8N46_10372 [Kordia periserrulae]